MFPGTGRPVIEQNDRWPVPPRAVEPHIRLGFCSTAGLLKYLNGGFIGVKDFLIEKSPMEMVVQWDQMPFRSQEHPVGQRLPGEVHSQPGQLLLLAVKGHTLD